VSAEPAAAPGGGGSTEPTPGEHETATSYEPAAAGAAESATGAVCASCGEPLVASARFCEACGAAVGAPASTSPDTAGQAADSAGAAAGQAVGGEAAPDARADDTLDTTLETTAPVRPCDKCGGAVAPDGWCTVCGHRAVEEVSVVDGGSLAYATHRGRRHERNEDSAALAVTADGWPVLVVSDGVSISPNPHLASRAAVGAAAARLGGRALAGSDDLVEATADAHAAASVVPADGDPHWGGGEGHPACTIVVAVATATQVHMTNVGDARGYVVRATSDGWTAEQVTSDDSAAAHAVAQGIDADVALGLPGGHAITAWLGADAHQLRPHLASVDVAPGDLVFVCSDGLWNYAATDQALTGLLRASLPPPGAPVEPSSACERWVSWAIDQGGADNICVALAPVPAADGESVAPSRPAGGPSDPSNEPEEDA
jgi:serine/threonine protein phosphatase PrpC